MLVVNVYLNDEDAQVLVGWLNLQPHIAFLVPIELPSDPSVTRLERNLKNPFDRWQISAENCRRAIPRLESIPKVPIDLWQISAGPLPHCLPGSSVAETMIADPFSGWCGRAAGSSKPSLPFFGSCPHTLRLDLQPESKFSWERQRRVGPNLTNTLGLSAIAWQGDRNKVIGYPAHPDMKRLWSKIREFVRTRSEKVSAADFLTRKDFYAFPGAYQDILRGRPRAPSR